MIYGRRAYGLGSGRCGVGFQVQGLNVSVWVRG